MMTQLLPLMMVLAWVSSFSGTVKNVVLEKEERVKEVLAVMGLGRGVQWAGWVAEGLRSTLITCVILVLIMKVSLTTVDWDDTLFRCVELFLSG